MLIGATVLGDAIFIQFLLDWIHVDVLYARFFRAPKAPTQVKAPWGHPSPPLPRP